jgi:hypothetical protein
MERALAQQQYRDNRNEFDRTEKPWYVKVLPPDIKARIKAHQNNFSEGQIKSPCHNIGESQHTRGKLIVAGKLF